MLKKLGSFIAVIAAAVLIACGSAAEAPPQPTPTTASTNPTPNANTPTPAPATTTPPPTPRPTATQPPDTPASTPTITPTPTPTQPPAMMTSSQWTENHGRCLKQFLRKAIATLDKQTEEAEAQMPDKHVKIGDRQTAITALDRLHEEEQDCQSFDPIIAPDRTSGGPSNLPSVCNRIDVIPLRSHGRIGENHLNRGNGKHLEDILWKSYQDSDSLPVRNGHTYILRKAMLIRMDKMPHTDGAGCWLITSLQRPTFTRVAGTEEAPDLTPENAVVFMTALKGSVANSNNTGEWLIWWGKTIEELQTSGGGKPGI